ncbi:MAG: alpha/beta hydrolase [Firmicutes bacterium]|nr:alpha/beta hydrolase [Bacillota bacterium]
MAMITGITYDNWTEYQKTVKLDTGITMAYVEAGNTEAPPLVLIHGFTDTGRVWRYMLQYLENDFHIYLPDLRGHGDSDKPEQDIQTVPEYAEDIIAFMKALGLEGGFVAGHSLGSMTAQAIGYLAPDIAKKIMMVETGARMHESPEEFQEMLAMYDGLGIEPELTIDDAPELFPLYDSFVCKEHVKYFIEHAKDIPRYVMRASLFGMYNYDGTRLLQFIKADTAVVWGTDEYCFTKEYLDEMKEYLPNAEYLIYEGGTHDIPDEFPEKLAGDMKKFFLEV